MLKDKKIGIIGTGNMGEALISGLVHSRSSLPENRSRRYPQTFVRINLNLSRKYMA